MAEYIKRSDALQLVFDACVCCMDACGIDGESAICDRCNIEGIKLCLRDMLAADVREVVTCAKCRYYSEKRKECGHINGLSELVFPTDYCSYGSVMREVDDD